MTQAKNPIQSIIELAQEVERLTAPAWEMVEAMQPALQAARDADGAGTDYARLAEQAGRDLIRIRKIIEETP